MRSMMFGWLENSNMKINMNFPIDPKKSWKKNKKKKNKEKTSSWSNSHYSTTWIRICQIILRVYADISLRIFISCSKFIASIYFTIFQNNWAAKKKIKIKINSTNDATFLFYNADDSCLTVINGIFNTINTCIVFDESPIKYIWMKRKFKSSFNRLISALLLMFWNQWIRWEKWKVKRYERWWNKKRED